jgi:hypothetical protein
MMIVWQRSRSRLNSALVSAGLARKSGHVAYGKFNAGHIVTRTLIPESPSFQRFSAFISPHKVAAL